MGFVHKINTKFHRTYYCRLPRRNNNVFRHQVADFDGIDVDLLVYHNTKNNNYYFVVSFLNNNLCFWLDYFDEIAIVDLSYLIEQILSKFRSEQKKLSLCSVLTRKSSL